MSLKQEKRRVFWYVTDFWEVFYAIPVRVKNNSLLWHLGDGLYETYYRPVWRNLYKRRKWANRAAKKLNRKAGSL